ncbi:snaclec A8-like [Montipora capricornis]|uniref:snaclec A8-like n=1 Tax=Montipora capricornis TaxID=246305 RepID=UPI0035F20A3F
MDSRDMETCLSPWTEFKRRCYRVTALRSYTWKGASAKCQSLQSHMLTINSEEENNFAAKLVQAHLRNHNSTQVHVWLGLFKSQRRGEFQWVDGSPFGNYSNWSPGEPNNVLGTELCTKIVIFGSSFRLKKWKDIRSQPLTVCEKSMREEN